MGTLERFHIYNVTHENIQINDKNTSKPNIIFDKIIQEETSRQLTNREAPNLPFFRHTFQSVLKSDSLHTYCETSIPSVSKTIPNCSPLS